MCKRQNTRKHHTHVTESQEASPFPAGGHNTARNKQDSMKEANKKHKYKKNVSQYKHRWRI